MPLFARMKRPGRYAPMEKQSTPQPWGGAVPAVQRRYIMAQQSAERREFPLLASLIYAPPSVVATPVEIVQAGAGQVDRIYQPAVERPRNFGDKLQSWFRSGRFE